MTDTTIVKASPAQVRAVADELVSAARANGQDAPDTETVRRMIAQVFYELYGREHRQSKECNDYAETQRIRGHVQRAWRGAGGPGSGAVRTGRPKKESAK